MTKLNTESIWKEYGPGIQRYILKYIGDLSLSEDLSQDIFIKVHKNIENIKNPDRISSWMYRIAHNTIMDYLRSAISKQSLDTLSLQQESEDKSDTTKNLAVGLPLFLRQLPEKYRQPLIMSDLQGMSQKEIAKSMGLSYSGARSRIQRGRRLLYKAYLECCDFELDSRNNPVSYTPRKKTVVKRMDYCR